jgi:small redox-active disulfide protein 2
MEEAVINIKVLGPGCSNCKRLEMLVHQAVASLSIEATVEKITDFAEMMKYPLLGTPGLVINEALVSAGRLPSQAELTAWLTTSQS